MQRNLEITTQNGTGCTIITSVKLSQEHIFSLAEESTIRGLIVKLGIDSKNELDRLVRIQGRDANRSYIRFFVPRNAKLLDSNNTTMTVSNEESMTVFAAYLTTGLNKKSSIEFAYMTEPKTCNREIIVIKQP
jgi:hypothetical protein